MIEENLFAYYRGLTKSLGGQFVEQEQIVWFTTGRRSLMRFNGILRTLASPENLAALAGPVLTTFKSENLPFFLAVYPPGATHGLGQFLSANGINLVMRGMPAMSRRLDNLPQPSLPDGAEIVEVLIIQDQADWLDVLMEGFEEPEESRTDFLQYLNHTLSESPSAWRHFLARWQGEPCAISTLLCAQQAAGLYHVATLPAYRGRGLGKAITLATLQAAREMGYSSAVLFATPDGYPLYLKLGFETVMTADFYAWSGK